MNLIELQEKIETKKAEKERLQGRKDSYMAQLKELGFTSIKKAQEQVKQFEKEIEKETEEFNNMLTEFENDFSELLEGE